MANIPPKRILHLFGRMDCGGAENMLMGIYRHVDRRRLVFEFLVHSPASPKGYFDGEIQAMGGILHHMRSQRQLGPWRYVGELTRFLRKNGPYDAVHSHMDWQGGLIALAAKRAGVPRIVVHAHTSGLMARGLALRAMLPLQKMLARRCATDHWACSKEAGAFLFGNLPGQRVIPNAIDLARHAKATPATRLAWRARWGCGQDTRVLCHAGSFSPLKNQLFLVEVAAELARRGRDIRWVLAGHHGNAYGRSVRERAVALGLGDSMFFPGVCDDLPDLLGAGDAFLFPSAFEGLGIVVVEAQASGLPCVVSTGVPAEVDMGAGLVTRVPVGSPAQWADAVDALDGTIWPSPEVVAAHVRRCGFDLTESSRNIERFYLGQDA